MAAAAVAALAIGYVATRTPPRRKKKSDTTGDGGGGEGSGQPDNIRKKLCERQPNRVWNSKLGRCVWRRKPKDKGLKGDLPPGCPPGQKWSAAEGKCVIVWDEVPTEYPPLPAALANAWCTTPLRLEPELVGTLLISYALPEYERILAGDFAPSESLRSDGRKAVKELLASLCPNPGAGLSEAITYFEKAADSIVNKRMFGAPIDTETSINRICGWDGMGTALDTRQVLTLVVDVGIDGVKRNQNRNQIAFRLLECSNRDAPVSGTASLALAQAVADIAIAVGA